MLIYHGDIFAKRLKFSFLWKLYCEKCETQLRGKC